MSFDFITPQLPMNKVLTSGASGTGSQDSGDNQDASSMFVVKLNQILAKNGIKQNVVTSATTIKNTESSTVDILSDSVKKDLLKEMNKAQGFEFLTKLKQYLMASGHNDLKGVSIGDDGLDAIKIMLDKAGFPKSKVAELMQTLKFQSDDGKVLVSDLMDGLLALDPEDLSAADLSADMDAFSIDKKSGKEGADSEADDTDANQLLDMSAIPFISSIMQSLGINGEIADSVISDAEVKGEGLSLNTLVSDLKALQKTSFFTGASFQNSSDVESIKGMFRQLGISAEKGMGQNGTDKGIVTLNDFVSALDGLRQKGSIKDSPAKDFQGAAGKDITNQSTKNLPDEISITGLNRSRKNSSSLISSLDSQLAEKQESRVAGGESDSLIKKLMGDLHTNDNVAKSVDESSSADSAMRYRTLKNSSRQLLMNLSASQETQPLKQDTQSLKTTLLNPDITGVTTSDALASATGDVVNGKVLSDLVHLVNNSEVLSAGKKSDQSRGTYNVNETDTILSGSEKRESLNILDSSRSGGSFSGQSDTRGGALAGTKEQSSSSILPSYVTNQVVRSINRAFVNGDSEIRLQLRPAELGRIFMTIETQGDIFRVNIITENQPAKDMLTEHANDLKASLANSGINVESFNVEMGNDFKQSMANSGQQPRSGSDSENNRGSSRLNRSSSAVESDSAAVPEFLNNQDGTLHFVA